jgi:putative transposase
MTDTMTTKTRKTKAKALKLFPDELIDQLLAQVQNKDAESILGESGLAGQLKKQLAERMLASRRTEPPPHHRSCTAGGSRQPSQRHQSEDGHYSRWRVAAGYSA